MGRADGSFTVRKTGAKINGIGASVAFPEGAPYIESFPRDFPNLNAGVTMKRYFPAFVLIIAVIILIVRTKRA